MKTKLPYLRLHLIVAFMLLLASFGQAQKAQERSKKFYSHTPEGLAHFNLSDQKILVRFKPEITQDQQSRIFGKLKGIEPLTKEMVLPSPKVTMAELQPGLTESAILSILSALNAMGEVEYANPFLVYRDGTLQGIQDRFIVKLKSTADFTKLKDLVRGANCSIESNYEYDPLVYFIKVSKISDGNALDLANRFAESQLFASAEPDFLLLLKRFNTNDPLLTYQWALNNTGSAIQYSGTPGADMKIFPSWALSTGNSSTKVAIIDEGVDLVHPDLAGNILPGFDGTQQNSGGAPQGDDAHGTACAGIVAAVGNNNLGVAGIAYNSKIVPVRIAYSSGASWVTSNAWIGTSIDWAWNQGDADVLSNSWGGGSASTLISDPINRAVTQGRGGLGAVVLFAAGNDNAAVSYPATLSNVISVAAMSMCNQRKTPSSCDGETWWGSNFGTNVDIAAPGVKIQTTDISGASGYSTGDYAATFNGTSSACPNAAGVMALILALNPTLSQGQARFTIESTCDKVGGYTYNTSVAGQPNGTWSSDLGYGRVNALTALQLATPVACTNPPTVGSATASPASFCTAPTTITLTLTGVTFGSGQSYQWQSSPNNSTWTSIAGANSMSYSGPVSASTYFRCQVTCGATTNSNSVYVPFTDPTILTFPHVQNFDSQATLPCGWTVVNANGDANTWVMSTTTPRSTPNDVFYTYNVSAAANDWLFTAPIVMQAGVNYGVRFWYRAQSVSFPEALEVKWGSSASEVGMTSNPVFSNANIVNTAYSEGISSTITPSVSGIYYVGFHLMSLADMYNFYLDDVTIEILPNCAQPNIGGTVSGNTTPNVGAAAIYSLTGATGTSIQWQTATSAVGPFTDVAGQTTVNGVITFNQSGNYFIRAKVSSPFCVDAYSNVYSVTATCLLANGGTAAGPLTIPSGQPGGYFASGYSGDTFFWQYSVDGGTNYVIIAGATTPNASFILPQGTNLVRFVSRFGTCTAAFSNVLTVVVTPPVGNTFSSPINLTLPQTITISTAAGSGYTSDYTGTDQEVSPDVFFRLTTGACVDSLKISTCNGTNFDTYIHFLNSTGALLTANDDNGYYCNGTTASLKTAVLPNTVYYIVVEGWSTSTGTFQLEVTPIDNPVFQATITPGGSTIFCEGEGVQLQASAGTQYLWSTGETTSFIQALTSGVYTVIVTGANGCESLASQEVEALPILLWMYDLDSDGYGDNNNGVLSCYAGPPGTTLIGGDCNDGNANINPGATEICNGVDDDCNAATIDGVDFDGDGYATCNNDCNDNNAAIHPGATEVCNGLDDDCDTQIDEGFDADNDGYTVCNGDCNDNNAAVNPGATETCNLIDDNCNIFIDEGFDLDEDGFTTCSGDCNDNNPNINPGITESCNAVDDNCDTLIDEGFDADNDGYYACYGDCDDTNAAINIGATEVCNGIDDNCDTFIDEGFDADADGYSVCEGDCNDLNAAVHPGAIEICNGVDDDCSAATIEGVDLDGDGYTSCNSDCNDNNAAIHPGAAEVCNGLDDDCDTQIDEGFDADNDGYTVCNGDCNDNNAAVNPGAIETCNLVDDNCNIFIDEGFDLDEDGFTPCSGDCDDSNPNINPGITESCNAVDDNCDTLIDEGFDADNDGYYACYGDCDDTNAAINIGATEVCNGIDDNCDTFIDEGFDADADGYSVCEGDCNDLNAAVNPGAIEICNGINDDCDSQIDEGFDVDNDGYTTCNGDCNDNNVQIKPGAVEICNGIDDDCDTQLDEGFDADNDGYTVCNGDCNDNNSSINPAATETCNSKDDDCDGSVDEGFDADGDGYTICGGDCNDNNGLIHPGATEICNGVDDNCNASIDEGFDVDADGYTTCNGDCNDNNAAVHPGATDICGNGIDEDCISGGLGDSPSFDSNFPTVVYWNCSDNLNGLAFPTLIGGCGNENISFTDEYISAGCGGAIVRTYKATSGVIEVASLQQIIYLVDIEAPIITCPANITTLTDLFQNVAHVTYAFSGSDNCSDVTYSSTHPSGSAFPVGTTVVTLTAEDDCGNFATCTFTVTVNAFLPIWYYQDNDGDGFGNPNVSVFTNIPPLGYVTNNSDCDDANPNVHPGVIELCNGFDDDCDSIVDEGCCYLTATAVATDAPCQGINNGSIDLSLANGTNPYAYTWSNGSHQQDIAGLAAGTYSVVVIDANGCSANASATVANLGGTAPAAPAAINGPYGVCRNSGGNLFSVAPVPGATSYIWTLPNGASGSSVTNAISLSFNGSYNTGNLCVRAVNQCGASVTFCRSVVAFTSNPTLPGNIVGQAINVCAGSTQTYSISPIANATNYNWTVPASATILSGQGTTSITIQLSAAFVSSGSVAVRSQNCFGASAYRTMTIYSIPGLPAAISGNANGVCAGSTQTYSVAALAGATSYVWAVPAGAVINSGQGTTSISVTFPTNFVSGVVSVKGQSSCGIGAARTMNVYSVPSLSGNITGTASGLCGGQFTYSITAPVGALSYNWTLPAGVTMVTNNGNSVTVNIPTNFVSGNICVTASNACGASVSKCLALVAKPATPTAPTGPSTTCIGQTGLVFTTPQVGTYTYTWTVPVGCSITSGQGTNSITVTWGSVSGSVMVRANNACGSSATSAKAVAVVACMQTQHEEDDTKQKFGKHDSELRIFPNPSDGHFMIRSDRGGVFAIYNEMGQEVKSFSLNSDNSYSQEIDGLSTGFYFIKGISGNEGIIEKIVVTNK